MIIGRVALVSRRDHNFKFQVKGNLKLVLVIGLFEKE